MSLRDRLKNGWLIEHKTSPQEITDLLTVADRDLSDSETSGLSPDWQLGIAYNAALAAEGYRATREARHYRTIQSLAFTIGADAKLLAQLDGFRKKRNIGDYERAGAVSEQEAGEMRALAKKLRDAVKQWLWTNHPDLLAT